MRRMKNKILLFLISLLSLMIMFTGCASKRQNTNADVLSALNDRCVALITENYEDGEINTSDVISNETHVSDIILDQIFYGSFSQEDADEIFVLCKILNNPHAAGFDKKVGIVLDAKTLEMVAYQEF